MHAHDHYKAFLLLLLCLTRGVVTRYFKFSVSLQVTLRPFIKFQE